MAARKKAAEPAVPFRELAFTRLVVSGAGPWGGTLDIDAGEKGLELSPGEHSIPVSWEGLPNLIAALVRAQEIHAGAKSAELPLFAGGVEEPPDGDDDDDE